MTIFVSSQQRAMVGPHTAALIHAARAEQPNNFLVDNGDLIQGSALGDWGVAGPKAGLR